MNAGQRSGPLNVSRRHQRGTVFQREDGMWIGKIRDPRSLRTGKRKMRTFASKNAQGAADKLDRFIDEFGADYHDGSYSTTGWLRLWAEEIHSGRVRPSTISKYLSAIDNHITPAIGDIALTRLAPHHIRRMLDKVNTSRNALTCYNIMNAALTAAVKERLIDHNPAAVVDKPRHIHQPRALLTADQAAILLASTELNHDPFHDRWAAAYKLGSRAGELLGLQWDRVDLTPGNATIDLAWQLQPLPWKHGCTTLGSRIPTCGKTKAGYCPSRTLMRPRGFEHQLLHKNLALTRPKTKASIRVVPLPESLRDMIAERKVRGEGPNPHNLVWHEPDGSPIHPTDDHNRWKDALAAAGLPDVTRHSSRATAATTMADAGVDEDTRMTILGHVSATAHRVYRNIDDTRIRAAMASLDQLMPEGDHQP